MPSLYLEQWTVQSHTGRIDPKTGEIARYKISLDRNGVYSCGCGAWTFQRGKLLDGRKAEEWEIPNGRCKHIMALIERRGEHEEAIAARQTVRIETDEFSFELEDEGRLKGLINGL